LVRRFDPSTGAWDAARRTKKERGAGSDGDGIGFEYARARVQRFSNLV